MLSGCKATAGCVAYVGISYLTQTLQAGLGYAALQNDKGQSAADPGDHRRRGGRLHQEDAGQRDHLADRRQQPGGYPIINFEYAIVSTTSRIVTAKRSGRCSSGP